LGEVISKAVKKQIRIAETEKYPHVTLLFLRRPRRSLRTENPGFMCPFAQSSYVPTFSRNECKGYPGQDQLPELEKKEVDFYLPDFAIPTWWGHTGNFCRCREAVETVDACNQAVNGTAAAKKTVTPLFIMPIMAMRDIMIKRRWHSQYGPQYQPGSLHPRRRQLLKAN